MADITISQLPVAEEDPESWNVIWIAGLPCPGICLPIDGERRRAVDHKKSKGSSRDLLLDQGLEPTECTVKIKTTDGTTFRSLYDFYLKYMDPERALSKLNVVAISHPQLYARGIKQGYFFSAPLPKPTADTGDRPYIHEFRFKIVGPKTQISAGSGSSKPKQAPTKKLGPTDQLFLDTSGADRAVAFFSILGQQGTGTFGNVSAPPGRPANQSPVIYSPLQQKAIADTGDPTARFAVGQFTRAAP